ncbi:unnamed protein product [Rhizophagus irregularis]|nr:unnamed protein product [Rhizophagus irregularis]
MLLINNINNENITFSNRPLFNYINISPQVPSRFVKNMIETLIKKEDKYGALTCFSQICVLTINILNVSSTLLFGMAKICKNVEDLTILYCDGDIPGLNRFIDVQTKLKSLRLELIILHNSEILYDGSVEMKEWEKYLSISSFPNLQHLETTYLPFYNDYMLIEKSNGRILEINIASQEPDYIHTKKLINSVVKYCPDLE